MASPKKFGLGRGLANLLSDISEIQSPSDATKEKMHLIAINEIEPGRYQPRRDFNLESIEELAASVKQQGIIQPIILRKMENQKYELIAGERRWRAAQLAGLDKVPSIIREMDDKTVIAVSIIENIQRENLNVIEEAFAYQRLKDEYSMTQEQIAASVGKARSTITNLLRLLNLHDDIKQKLIDKLLETGHAKLLLSFTGDDQIKIADVIVSNKLTVRQTEKLIDSLKKPETKNTANPQINKKIQIWEEKLSKHFHAPVKIKVNNEGKGRVIVNLETVDEIEWIINKFEQI